LGRYLGVQVGMESWAGVEPKEQVWWIANPDRGGDGTRTSNLDTSPDWWLGQSVKVKGDAGSRGRGVF
jgi:hypothetical protein